MIAKLRIIGDVHGLWKRYLDLLPDTEYSLQLGDMGFNYQFLIDNEIDAEKHRFFGGNHDNYDRINEVPHNLGKYGVWTVPDCVDVFWLRGGWSIDQKYRVLRKSWWPEEELGRVDLEEAFELYSQIKPDLVVTHEPPFELVEELGNIDFARNFGFETNAIPTKTNQTLQKMVEFHRPKLHIFGHFHKDFDKVVEGTRYICLPELNYIDLPVNFSEHYNV